MKTTIPAATPVFTIPVPVGSTAIQFNIRVKNLDPTSNAAPQLAFSGSACDGSVTENFQATPGSQCGTLGSTGPEALNGLVLSPDIIGGGTYMSQVSGPLTCVTGVTGGASITVTPGNYSANPFELEITATVT